MSKLYVCPLITNPNIYDLLYLTMQSSLSPTLLNCLSGAQKEENGEIDTEIP